MKKYLIAAFAVLALSFGLNSCDKSNAVDSGTSDLTTQASEVMVVPAFDAGSSDIVDCTETSDAALKTCDNDVKSLKLDMPFAKLQLTQDQIDSIKPIVAEHRLCVKSVKDSLRNSEVAILKTSNEARKAIIADFKAGTITRDSAIAAFVALNKTTRAELKANPVLAWAKTALTDCNTEMYTLIRVLLTDNQKVIFDAWLAKHKV